MVLPNTVPLTNVDRILLTDQSTIFMYDNITLDFRCFTLTLGNGYQDFF